MKISSNKPFEPVRPESVKPAGTLPAGSSSTSPVSPVPAASRSDRVQISDAGRALASEAATTESATLTPERTAELRRKVLEGAYNSLNIVDQVAQRILDRGDA
jgi:hypothetical protein